VAADEVADGTTDGAADGITDTIAPNPNLSVAQTYPLPTNSDLFPKCA